MIDYAKYRKFFGPVPQALIKLVEQVYADPYMTDRRWKAYLLATVKHETANTFLPTYKEIRQVKTDTPRRRKVRALQDRYWYTGYFGRGPIHFTWEDNYEKAEKFIRKDYPQVVADFEKRTGRAFDLTIGDQPNDRADPDNITDADIGYAATSSGMRLGWLTGHRLSDYFNTAKTDWNGARRIINGVDQAAHIGAEAQRIFECLS